MDFRERVAIAFMAVSLLATVGLGAAVAFELGRNTSTSAPVAATVGTATADTSSTAQPGLAQTGGTPAPGSSAAAGTAGSAGTPVRTVTTGGGTNGAAAGAPTVPNRTIG